MSVRTILQPPASIVEAFVAVCQHDPTRPLVHFAGETYSYGQIYHAAMVCTTELQERGLKPGDRVGLFLASSPAFLAAYLGVHLMGGIVVLINIQYRQVELRHILNDSGAVGCITDAERQIELEGVRSDARALAWTLTLAATTWLDEWNAATASEIIQLIPPAILPTPDAIALLAYTSGTTGRSKGAMLSHGNLAANSAAVAQAWHWTAADTLLLTLPLFHIHGLGVGVHGTLLTGAALELQPRFDAEEVYQTLCKGEVTMFFGVPTMYTRLLAVARNQGRRPPPLRLYVSGSAPLDPQTFAEFAELFGQQILERYGMTETVMNLTNPYEGERRPGTVGQPFPGQEARIVDTQTRQLVTDERVGEIQVRGPNICQGYWQRPDATAEVFDAEGWFSTGDLGWCSADGYYTIVGRAKELIITGGYNVYPREIEEVLLSHPALSEAAVFGLPDLDMGQQVAAAVVLQAGATATAAEIGIYCREQLAAYKKPRQILFVTTLPRNALGKVQKHLLREQIVTADDSEQQE